MTTGILGTIQLHDKSNTSEQTSAQVLTSPVYDSRLYPTYGNLSYHCIRELRKDATVQLARWAVLSPMIHTPWVYINNNGKATREMIDLIDETFSPLREWFLAQAVFGTLDFGWQPFEIIYKPENGYVYIDSIKPLIHDYTTILVYLENGKFAGFANETFGLNTSVLVEEEYALNTNFEVEGTDWYGYSVFNTLHPILKGWNNTEDVANRYDRKVAGATWVIYYPVGQTPYNGVLTPNDQIARSILNRLEASGSVAIPDEIQDWADDSIDEEAKGKWRIELITANASTAATFIDRQKYLDALKMRAFALTERSMLEGSHGTKAEADIHGDVALSIVDSRHRLICHQLNLGPVQRVLQYNFGKKYAYAVSIRPAPLVDTQFATLKRIYELILQNPETLMAEVGNLDIKALRDEIGIPSSVAGTNSDSLVVPQATGDNINA